MPVLKKRVLVTMTQEIEIEIPEAFFAGMTHEQFFDEWRKGLGEIDGIDTLFNGAAVLIAQKSDGIDFDGYGAIRHKQSRLLKEDEIRFSDNEPDYEVEFLN